MSSVAYRFPGGTTRAPYPVIRLRANAVFEMALAAGFEQSFSDRWHVTKPYAVVKKGNNIELYMNYGRPGLACLKIDLDRPYLEKGHMNLLSSFMNRINGRDEETKGSKGPWNEKVLNEFVLGWLTEYNADPEIINNWKQQAEKPRVPSPAELTYN